MGTCEHVSQIKKDIQPKTKSCEECEKEGTTDQVVSLRMCMTCGHVGDCDSGAKKHARKHFEQTKHPIMRSLPLGGDGFVWCYIDNKYIDLE